MKTQRQSVISSALIIITMMMISAVIVGGRANVKSNLSSNTALQQNFGQLPLSFIPNAGQIDASVHFQVNSLGGALFFTPQEVVLSLTQLPKAAASEQKISALTTDSAQPSSTRFQPTDTLAPLVVKMQFIGVNSGTDIVGADQLPGIVNYFLGNEASQWHTNLPTYAGITYRNIYPGIDLHYDGHQGRLKGTYTVAPNADPTLIRWRYSGHTDLSIDAVTGDLLISLANGNALREVAPTAWQDQRGQRVSVATHYALAGDNVRFAFSTYDATLPLIIDPDFEYSTYLGGADSDTGNGIVVDSVGNAYIVGHTLSTNFPTQNGFQNIAATPRDVTVTKLNPTGSAVLYSTYLGGSGTDYGFAIALDADGSAYVTGSTRSADFPMQNAFQSVKAESSDAAVPQSTDAFVTKLNPAGNALVYSTFLGGSGADVAHAIVLDSSNNVYLTGSTFSDNFPLHNAFQTALAGDEGAPDGFITVLSAAGNTVNYSTYFGGTGPDSGQGIFVSPDGSIYVTGNTNSKDLPLQNAIQSTKSGVQDAFVAKFNTTGDTLLYATYLGGTNPDGGNDIAVDSDGNAYVIGSTISNDFPVHAAFQSTLSSLYDAFVAKLNPMGNALVYSTFFGGQGYDSGFALALDSGGNVYLTGYTESPDFPLQGALKETLDGTFDVYVAKLNAAGDAVIFSTFIGGNNDEISRGIALDSSGVYITGNTASTDFSRPNGVQEAYGGGENDMFVTKLSDIP